MHAVGVFDDLVDIIGKSIFLLVQGINLEGAATLRGHTAVVPPGELGDQNLLIITQHQEIVDGILQHVLTTVGQKHLLLRYTVNLAHADGDDTFLTLIIDTSIETQGFGIKVLDCIDHLIIYKE